MSLLTLSAVGQSFGALDLFSGISVSLPRGGKVGLVGPNGIGKSTLLRIIAGLEEASAGTVSLFRGTRVGYLRQEAVQAFRGNQHSIWEEMLSVFEGVRDQEAELQALEAQLASHPHDEALLDRYGAAQERFAIGGGYDYEQRIRMVLQGLGFRESQWEMAISHLSGGQMTRALLARLMLERPDLLILDEPTNHLDADAVEWLETALRLWEGSLIVVSHDRYFLDRVVDRIWELSRAGLADYRGNYSAYVTQRQERWEYHEKRFESEKARMERELELIRRTIAGQNSDNAMGRLSRLGRELQAIEALGLMAVEGKSWSALAPLLPNKPRELTVAEAAQLLGSLRGPQMRPPRVTMRLRTTLRGGDEVLRTRDLVIGYDRPLLRVGDLLLERQECVALIGPNGTGKTTFLKTVLGQLAPLAGSVRLGAGLKIGYFAQAHDRLNLDRTVLDEMMSHGIVSVGEARDYLAQYLFREDEVYRPIRALSGGERGRLALAILARQGANLLLLDEPTNHLDIPAQEVLQESLEAFGGTILMVSHDRYLVERLATQIWAVAHGEVRAYSGGYEAYRAALQAEREAERERRTAPAAAAPIAAPPRPTLSKGERRRREERLSALEREIEAVEAEIGEHEQAVQLATAGAGYEAIQQASSAYERATARLATLMDEWGTLAEELADG